MAALRKNDIAELVYASVQKKALGNTGVPFKKVCSDYINAMGRDHLGKIADGSYLCKSTVERVADCDDSYRPQSETLERIMTYFNVQAEFTQVKIKSKFQNRPKD